MVLIRTAGLAGRAARLPNAPASGQRAAVARTSDV
jgi:hypothetical protein